MTDSISRKTWTTDLKPYLAPNELRSLGQMASSVGPYLAIWVIAAIAPPLPWYAYVGLGLIGTIMLVRMYSLFHDLTHGALFKKRATNRRFGVLLGYFLFTPFAWWQRQHNLHHAHNGDLDEGGPGEIATMTVADYQTSSWLKRLGYRAYRNPILLLLIGPTLVFLFERRFPQKGMNRRMLANVITTNVLLAVWVGGWIFALGLTPYLIMQVTTVIVGGAIGAWMLYIQHQYEDTYYQRHDEWSYEQAALQGSSFHSDTQLQPARCTRIVRNVRADAGRDDGRLVALLWLEAVG